AAGHRVRGRGLGLVQGLPGGDVDRGGAREHLRAWQGGGGAAMSGKTVELQPPLLEVVNLARSFGKVSALENVSMAVRAGEVMCVLGDNGAGKSTLIKILSGVHPHERGRL